MSSHTVLLAIHVLTAVLGVGAVTGLAVGASASDGKALAPAAALQRLSRVAGWSLVVMLVTGIGLAYGTGGSFGASWWMPVSVALFLALGGTFAALRPAVRRAAAATGADALRALSRVAWIARLQCGLVAVIVVLMVSKPF